MNWPRAVVNCNDPEIQDDPALDDYNVDDVVRRNVEQARLQQSAYVGDIYYTMGFDFNFESVFLATPENKK